MADPTVEAAISALGEAIVAKNRAVSAYLKAKGELDDANAALRHAENRYLRAKDAALVALSGV